MSFNFGSNQPAFGATPAKPTAFGAPFGTPATTTSMGFGGFGTTFGQQTQPSFGATSFGQTPTPAFGQSSFGQPTATPAFGASTFGTPAATSAPAFGTTFGTPSSAATPFGTPFTPVATSTNFASPFGATPASAPPTFAGFGTPASTTPNLFGASAQKPLFGQTSTAGLFGTTTTPSGGTMFGTSMSQPLSLFSSAQPVATPAGGFAPTTSTAAPSLFSGFGGAATTTTTPSLFGATSAPNFSFTGTTPAATSGFGLFGPTTTTTTTSQPTFAGFGPPAGGFSGFSGFGATTTTTPSLFSGGAFGLKPAGTTIAPTAAPPTEAASPLHQTLTSFYNIHLFGDERDAILKKWNMLQACWGTGKGYYQPQKPPVDYTPTNPFYRFKSVGYVVIPGEDNTAGLVKLTINKKLSDLTAQKEGLINGIVGILGNKPNLTVNVENIKSVGENQSEMMISVTEKDVTGTSRKVLASDLATFLNQTMAKQQLTNAGVSMISPFVTPTKSQLQEYLKNPPPGIELQLWQAAQIDNPNPSKFMPCVVNGLTDLKKRMTFQQHETDMHQSYLSKVSDEIVELKKKNANSIARINELKQKYAQLYQRLLKILIKQQTTTKMGMALTQEEEMLKTQLQNVIKQMTVPLPLKNQITEVWSNLTLNGVPDILNNERYKMDPDVQEHVKQFLQMEQTGINHLIEIIRDDVKSLKIISDGLQELQSN